MKMPRKRLDLKDSEMRIKAGGCIKTARILLPVLLCILCVFLLQNRKIQKNEIRQLSEKLEEMERSQLEIDTIKEEIRQISKYSVTEYNYTSIIHFSEKNTIYGFEIPLTGNNFIATIDGKMNIGINGDEVDFTENRDADGKVTQVKVILPHSEIQDNYTEAESLKVYDEKNNIFNPVKVSEYNDRIVEAEEREKKKVLESDILEKADERIRFLLTAHFQALYGNGVKITCEFQSAA